MLTDQHNHGQGGRGTSLLTRHSKLNTVALSKCASNVPKRLLIYKTNWHWLDATSVLMSRINSSSVRLTISSRMNTCTHANRLPLLIDKSPACVIGKSQPTTVAEHPGGTLNVFTPSLCRTCADSAISEPASDQLRSSSGCRCRAPTITITPLGEQEQPSSDEKCHLPIPKLAVAGFNATAMDLPDAISMESGSVVDVPFGETFDNVAYSLNAT
ncbi:uncharacterized protein MCYG_01935 [Microsporum canis CBS 113480]|uniref:Uncharacterized protein n=1 Tax=Arthroderma otae (strain ATCC MYA-4605 / CBS 113480) TaxID=554155 RepID=C5FID6_ARTOC|nr:uncharacterized protein MCYG_01935 [Microsporum canis CBS 113480]EEQ29116.1 predicted protein [Microsporum canis CBS 113480]